MPLTTVLADALGVVTISLVSILFIIGSLCILYIFYFRDHICSQNRIQFGYFTGPWVIRIIFIIFSILWALGEITRLEFLRREGRVLQTLDSKWQETICKCYIVSNLGFSEPCLILTLIFLLRASLQSTESGPLSPKWNFKTAIHILLLILPVFAFQMAVVLIGPQYETDLHLNKKGYFFKFTSNSANDDVAARCYYPLLSTIFLGLFATMLTLYLLWLGRRILILVINKGLQKRVYTLIFVISTFFPIRVLLLGLSVLFKPGDPVFEIIAFLAFVSLLSCIGVGICILVYFPIADSFALKNLQDMEASRRIIGDHDDNLSLISFRAVERDEDQSRFVELSHFSDSQHLTF